MPLDEIAYVSEMLLAFIAEYLLRPETAFGASFHPVVIFETKKINQSFIREKKKITIND